jgi:hypothetical protein
MGILYVLVASGSITLLSTGRIRLKRRLGYWAKLADRLDMVRKKFGETRIITAYSERKELLKRLKIRIKIVYKSLYVY